MSGGKKANRKRDNGWEEAGSEFYQESYNSRNVDLAFFQQLERTDTNRIATLLPSKQERNRDYSTVKRVRSQMERRASTAHNTATADLHLSMMPDLSSDEISNEERIWEEIMQIKSMPISMTQKKELKTQLQNATKLRLQGFEQFQWRQRKVIHRVGRRFDETLSYLKLWNGSLKKIEGNYGTGVVSFFLFLRWMFFLNLAMSLIIIVFLILPKALLDSGNEGCDENLSNSSQCCADVYFNQDVSTSDFYIDFVQGTGWMERTILFYGLYPDKILAFQIGDNVFYYNMPLAYVLVIVSIFLLSLATIMKSAAKGFKEKLVEREGQFYKYCNIVFSGWDFCIHNEKSASIKHKALYNELRMSLEQERWSEERHSRSKKEQLWLILRRILINAIVIVISALAALLILYVFDTSMRKLGLIADDNQVETNVTESFTNYTEEAQHSFLAIKLENGQVFDILSNQFFFEFLPAMTIVLLNLIVPEIFAFLVKYENYSPTLVLKVTLYRTIFLRLASLSVLIVKFYLQVTDPNRNPCPDDNDNVVNSCWETYVGQMLYKLILTDFFIQLIMAFLVNFPRSLLAKYTKSSCLKRIGTLEFYLPKHVLDIVYSQAIVWLGAFYCPFLPIIGTLFYFFIFYIKRFICLVNCSPSASIYNASKSKSLFMLFVLLSYVLAIVPVAYSIAELTPSISCGPFRGLESVWSEIDKTFNSFPGFLKTGFLFLGTASFAIPLFLIFICLLYYYWAVAQANRIMVNALKSQLILEGHDKQFLLNRLTALIKQRRQGNTEIEE